MPAYTISKTSAGATSPDNLYGTQPQGPGLPANNTGGSANAQVAAGTAQIPQWNGALDDPNGLMTAVYAIAAREGNGDNVSLPPNWTVVGDGSYGAWQWQWVDNGWQTGCQQYVTANGLHPYAQYASTYPSQCPPAAQLAIATMQIDNLFQQYHNWYSVAQAWNGGAGGVGQSYTDSYAQHVVANMQAIAKLGGPVTGPTSPSVPEADQSGTLINSPVPVDNTTIVQPGPPLNVNNLQIRGTPVAMTKVGDVYLVDLISDCTLDQTVSQLSSLTVTFQQGDVVANQLGVGIGDVNELVEVDFCDSDGNILWPFAISTVQMTANAAQQPALEVTCTSKLLQIWQGIYPKSGSAPPGSPTSWLYQQAEQAMGRSQYSDGRWVFAGEATRTGDPNFIVQPPDPSTGTIQSSVYDVAQAVQSSQAFYLFDGRGTTWFGEPSWITLKTETVNIAYVTADLPPYDGTVAPAYAISPVGPPQLSMTIQTVPNGFGIVQQRQIVRTVTCALPQYIAAQLGAGGHVVLSGCGPQYDTNKNDPWLRNATDIITPATSALATTIGPQQPYIITEVTGTVDGGLSTWNVTFQEAVLPSQPTSPSNVVSPVVFSSASVAPYTDPITGQSLSPSGNNSKLATNFIGYATSVVGDQYAWGAGRAQPPSSNTTFDCSGLVIFAAEQVGIQLYGTAADIASLVTPIPNSQIISTPGALAFLNDGTGPNTHVAISLGNGQFVAAAGEGAFGGGTGPGGHGVGIYSVNYDPSTGYIYDASGQTYMPDGNIPFTHGGIIPGMVMNGGIGGIRAATVNGGAGLNAQGGVGGQYGPQPVSPDKKG